MFSRTNFHCSSLPTQGSNRGHDVPSLLEAFIASVWCGANRFLHTELTRNDAALRGIFGWKSVPSQDAYKRYFNKFSQATNAEVSQHFYSWVMSNINFNPDYALGIVMRVESSIKQTLL